MQRQQAVKEHLKAQSYIEKNKLRPYFSELTKLLLLKKPEDLIKYLIDYLQKRNKRQIICVNGYDSQTRKKLTENVANKFNYKIIQVQQLFKNQADYHFKSDKEINDAVLHALNAVESVYKGIIISGYPNNLVQTDFIQKSGLLPERYFFVHNNQQKIKEIYDKKFQTPTVEKMLLRNSLELKQVNQLLGDLLDKLPQSYEQSKQKMIATLNVKAYHKITPYDSPRIVILYPPYLIPKSVSHLIERYSLNPISVEGTLKKLSNKPEFIKNVQSYIRIHGRISKQIQLAMIQTSCKSAASKNKGYALCGWPLNKDRLALFKQHFINPHLIIIFTQSKNVAIQQFQKLPQTDSNLFSITKKPTKQAYQKVLTDYLNLIQQIKTNFKNSQQFQMKENQSQVIKVFANLMQNNKIYS